MNPLAGTLDPYVTNTNPNTNGTFLAYLDNWSVEEKTTGLLHAVRIRLRASRNADRGNVGIRYVDTDTNSTGYTRVQQGSVITYPVDSIDGGYSQALPSMNLKVGLIPDVLVARFAAGKVMARPSPAQLAIRRSIDVVGFTGSRGNPSLLPFLATNYDLGLEWYFSEQNYASLAAFRKEISRFIINETSSEVNPNDGLTYQHHPASQRQRRSHHRWRSRAGCSTHSTFCPARSAASVCWLTTRTRRTRVSRRPT